MYSITKEVKLDYKQAIERAKDELQKEGFGVMTEIDVKATLKKKLDVEFDDYMILGACNPNYAYKALQMEDELGLLLPCNLIVYRKNGKTFVSAIKPTVQLQKVSNEKIKPIALEVEKKLAKVIESI